MKTKTNVKSDGSRWNHSQSAAGVKVQSSVKAGQGYVQNNLKQIGLHCY